MPAAIAGYVAFLLSFARSAWLSWAIGLTLSLRGAKPKTIARVVVAVAALFIVLVPLLQKPDLAPALGDRLKTLTELKRDESFNERQEMYRVVGNVILHDPFGHGLRNQEIVRQPGC